jgi:predicted DNA-binding protein
MKKLIAVRLDSEADERLKQLSAESGLSQAEIVSRAIELYWAAKRGDK